MKLSRISCTLVLFLLASCVTVPDDCSSLAALDYGWRSISPPANATELIAALPGNQPGPLHWYSRDADEYRITSCAPCNGVAYVLHVADGAWVADADALSYCHP